MGRQRRKHERSHGMAHHTVTPYDTGKIKIGCMYTPPRRVVDLGVHAELLQTALLGIHMPWYQRVWRKWFGGEIGRAHV